MRELTQS